jgi:hypothetical protein
LTSVRKNCTLAAQERKEEMTTNHAEKEHETRITLSPELLSQIEVVAADLELCRLEAMDPQWCELAAQVTTTEEERGAFHAQRAALGKYIDPATAEITCWYGFDADPYGIRPDIPEAMQQVGKQYFARQRGGAVWICFDDLPPPTIAALFARLSSSRSEEEPLSTDPLPF